MFCWLNNHLKDPKENGNSGEEYTTDKDLFINSAVFNTVIILSNYIDLNDGSSIINLKNSENKVQHDLYIK